MNIDLRSDTITKPTPGMLKAITNAIVGDDVYNEDPTVNELEARFATMFGKEKALFFPTGTMANQTAIKVLTQPGEQMICDKWAHVYNYEGGGASLISGISCKLIDGTRGMMTAQQVEENINPPDFYHSPSTSLVCLENTTNKGGGACYNLTDIIKIREVCDKHNLGFHLDGARLFNAIVAKGEKPKQYGDLFDTISICLSKGLGTPLGSVLVGDAPVMDKARRLRKALGGGMRQIGLMAAAGLYALDHHIERLAEDHHRAKEIGELLKQLPYVNEVEKVETNIVIFYLKPNIKMNHFRDILALNGVQISTMGQEKLRIVTHLDYNDKRHNRFIELLKNLKI